MPFATDQSSPEIAEVLALLQATRNLQVALAGPGRRDMPVLTALKAAGRRGLTQVQLAAALSIAPTRMSRLIDLLEPEGTICRQSHPLDRRSKVIQLTELGQQKLAMFEVEACRRYREVFRNMPKSEISSLRELLKRMSDLLAAQPSGDRPAAG
ncbi:MAG: MarR family transcriptional regulator [bacterium]|nr:MAG: MarR family transcriptional regulator [bacterium]